MMDDRCQVGKKRGIWGALLWFGIPGAAGESAGHHLLNRARLTLRATSVRACSHKHRHTQRAKNTNVDVKRQDRYEDLQDDPGLCGLRCAPHCCVPVTPVLTESSDAVVAVHVSANVPQDHIEN